MTLAARATALASLAGIGLVTFALLSGGVQSPPAQVTTDTPAYCKTLGARVRVLMPMSADALRRVASQLADEGESLCARGEIRGGLLRLRQAMHLVTRPMARPH